MTYLETENLTTLEEEINNFQSSYSEKQSKVHIVFQSINGYELELNEVDESARELHSFIVNQASVNFDNKDITKNDIVYLITSTKLSFSDNQSLQIKNVDTLGHSSVQKNIEIKYKKILLNLIIVYSVFLNNKVIRSLSPISRYFCLSTSFILRFGGNVQTPFG